MKKPPFTGTFLILRPPLSPHLLVSCEAWLKAHLELEEGESLDPSSTALLLCPTVKIAKRALDAVFLPPEVLGIANVFLAGSVTGSLDARAHYPIVGYIAYPHLMESQ